MADIGKLLFIIAIGVLVLGLLNGAFTEKQSTQQSSEDMIYGEVKPHLENALKGIGVPEDTTVGELFTGG